MYSFFESSLRNSKRTFSFRDDPQKHHKSCSGVAHASGKYNATSDEYNRTCKIHEKRNCKSCEIPKNVPSFQKVSSLSSDGHSETESVESGTQEEPFDRNKPENKSLKKKFAAFKRSDSAPVNLGVKKDNTATKSDDRASKNPQEIRRERLKQILNSRASPTQNKSFEESLVPTFPTKKEENNCSSFRRRFPSFRRSGSAPDKLGNAKPKEVKDDFDVHLGGSSKDPRAERRQRLKEILKSRASFRAEPGQRRSYTKSCNSDHSFDEIKIPATSTIAAAAATSVINKPEKIEFKTSLRVSFNRKFGHTTVSGDYYKNVVPTVSKNNIAQKSVKVEESVHHQPATESVPQSKPQVPPKPSVKPVNVVVVGGGRLRTSFRKSIKKLQKIKTATWEELYNIALNRKATIGDEGSYLKSWNDFILQRLEEEGIEQAKTEDQIANEIEWLDAERVWLVHRGGFTCAKKITTTAEGDIGKLRIQIDQTGEILEVDEDDLEKANPPQFDRAEDLAVLRHLNESSILHTVRQRYASNLIHTYAGSNTLLVVNPMAPLAIYSEKVVSLFKGCKSEDMPPHIYSVAQSAYHDMLSTRKDQSILFMGRGGSGKTTNFRHAIQYLLTATGSVNKILSVEKLTSVWTVLESFGNAKTVLNANATKFTQIFSLDFDQSGCIASASIQTLMLEKSRIARKNESEGTFHVMYRLLSGVDGHLRKDLFLDQMTGNEQNAFMTPLQKQEDKQKAQNEFVKLCNAMNTLGVIEQEQKVIWLVLAAIYHLGCAGATKAGISNSRYQFLNPQSAQRAAYLLGTTVEELSRLIFGLPSGSLGTPSTPRAPFRTPSPIEKGIDRDVVGLEALEGMVVGLYSELFNAVISLINRSISAPVHTVSSILLVDAPGFQNPATCGKQTGASFEELCHNYLQERLQLLFYYTNMVAPHNKYVQENVELEAYDFEGDNCINPRPMVNLLDKTAHSTVVRTSQSDLQECDRRGMLWLLDEEAMCPGTSDEAFLERVFTHYGDKEHQVLIRKAPGSGQFVLQHLQGTNPVLYNTNGWVKASRENPVSRSAVTLLQESSKDDVVKMFVNSRGLGPSSFSGSMTGIEGSQSLRRASSIRRTFTAGAAAIKRKSICLQTKFSVDGLVETLRRTKLRFVYCLLPQHNAGVCDSNPTLLGVSSSDSDPEDAVINVPLLRSQLRGGQLLESVRMCKQGFPQAMPLSEFRRRFQLLTGELKPASPILDERKAVEDVLLTLDLDMSGYRVGLSQIFLRSGVLAQLENQRDEHLAGMVVSLQAHCRGYITRKKLIQRRLQDIAVRCIQRNVRKFLVVRDWPWWRLLVRVTPLLNVHRTEEELKNKTEELENLKAKVEKLESERTLLKYEKDKLEAKLSEMTADLAEEHSTSTLATERLEAETSERMRLERELTEVQNKNKVLQDSSERLELELLYAKSDLNGISEEDDDGCADNNDANIYKQRYERAKKELEFTKKRLQQQHEDDLEQLVGLKKQLEKKLTDAYEEVEEQKQVVGQWKRKVQKLNSETNDLRLLLEEQSARNNLLEKKQRKFDSEMQLLQDELRSERQARDRLSREKDVILTEKYNVETNLADTKLELELKEEKLRALQKELDELTHGGKTEEEIAVLRKQKMDMERRLLDQEEELDELAGQVQLLEQSKVRLEMSLEQQRKEAKKEAQQRDDEIEEIRCNAQKKVKALEAQLENEHEERTQLLRDKHELERRLTAFAESDRNDRAGDEALLQRLKRDLKRSKVLLRDTQAQLDRQKSENPSKAVIRQLRNQIEDLDYARSSAVKAKQSVETELFELQTTLEETQKGRHDAEEKVNSLSREKSDLQAQLEENEEELAEVLKKYKAAVQQMSLDQLALQEQVSLVSELEAERNTLKEQLAEVTSKLESAENIGEASSNLLVKRLELKNKELESKLDLEQTTRSRLETQITRLKEAVDKLQNEIVSHRTKEQLAQENVRKLQKNIRELKEELGHHQSKENEWLQKKKELEKRCECLEVEASASKADLKLALKRIEDLQAAIQGDLEEGTTESDSEQVSYSSEESLNSFPSKLSLKPTGFDGERRLSGTSKSSSMSNSQGKDGSFA
ncbi:unconventional myosin-XVIIIa isoform X2 [Agrilus planipennis]|uniref:Unconventional myosin-XVIIIa isoform X2 n=1 Tax=Agrilus planipennis TaxID=224129 RepID=A0A7F5RLA7_AGRPL|nr:unconventional myosin-XVIIIa isoform X2 [Agrilus planipennis]